MDFSKVRLPSLFQANLFFKSRPTFTRQARHSSIESSKFFLRLSSLARLYAEAAILPSSRGCVQQQNIAASFQLAEYDSHLQEEGFSQQLRQKQRNFRPSCSFAE